MMGEQDRGAIPLDEAGASDAEAPEAGRSEPPGPDDGVMQSEISCLRRFWSCGPGFDEIDVSVTPPDRPHTLLEKLGPSPFERGGFPVIGFLATTYDKVTRFALERE